MTSAPTPLLAVDALSIAFTRHTAGLRQTRLTVVTDLDLTVHAGEVVAVVGSSGSGKSLLAHAVLGLLPSNAEVRGALAFRGEPLTPARQAALRGREIALIPQSVGYLDPMMPVGRQVRRAGELSLGDKVSAAAAQTRIFEQLELDDASGRYPFQVSGGMARRVLVSTAAIGAAALVIADEPTHGLHPRLVAEALRQLRALADAGRGVMLITHDIEEALNVADRVVVFYAGSTLEIATATDFASGNLRHPYTQALWRALPGQAFEPIAGVQPQPDALPPGCLFADRCPLVDAACRADRPALRTVRGGQVRCLHA
jgi:peptide/nickel transport system ATP-binding protein